MSSRVPLLLPGKVQAFAPRLKAEDGGDGGENDEEEQALLNEGPAVVGGGHDQRLFLGVLAAGPLDTSRQICLRERVRRTLRHTEIDGGGMIKGI